MKRAITKFKSNTSLLFGILLITAVFLGGHIHAQTLPEQVSSTLLTQPIWENGSLIRYPDADRDTIEKTIKICSQAKEKITTFFKTPFKKPFTITIVDSRDDFTAILKKEWGVPETEAWMIACGVADFMVMISPRVWLEEAAEHNPKDPRHVQEIITHELIHVYHGQHNPTGDFSGAESIGWFAEGLATFLAGQMNEDRINRMKIALKAEDGPKSLQTVWSGPHRYGFAGSLVEYIFTHYDKTLRLHLLAVTHQNELLKLLDSDETSLLDDWTRWILEK